MAQHDLKGLFCFLQLLLKKSDAHRFEGVSSNHFMLFLG